MSKRQSETFAMGRFGTVVPCSTTTPLADELVMLGRLIGTTDPRGRAEARGIVERVDFEASSLVAALRAILPYAESRLEDLADIAAHSESERLRREAEADHTKARAAFEAAKAAIAMAVGRALMAADIIKRQAAALRIAQEALATIVAEGPSVEPAYPLGGNKQAREAWGFDSARWEAAVTARPALAAVIEALDLSKDRT